MKKILVIIFCFLFLLSCSNNIPKDDRIIIGNLGITPGDMSSSIAEIDLNAVIEMNNLCILGEIVEMTEVHADSLTGIINFEYIMNIKEIFYTSIDSIKVGDEILMMSTSGIVKANELKDLHGNSQHAQKFGYLNKEFNDNEYFISSAYDKIPMEVGKQYILYLTDRFYETDGLYVDQSYEYIYEYTNNKLYNGTDTKSSSMKYNELKNDLYNQGINRTGIVDEIGVAEYLKRLGEQQALELENNFSQTP